MSIINSFCLLLLLSLHASDARSLRNHTSREVDQREENEKLDATRVSNEATGKANPILPNNGTRDIAKDLDNEKRAVVDEAKDDDVVSKRSEVDWKVPHHKKGGQPEPGFNLDYLPPKTHPPVHN